MIIDGAYGCNLFCSDGVCDRLNLTNPDLVSDLHHQYCLAGADYIKTNTFNSNDLNVDLSYFHSYTGARLALQYAREYGRKVLGSIGSSGELFSTMSYSGDEVWSIFRNQVAGLIQGGVDAILVETVIDLFQLKSILQNIRTLNSTIPIWVSFSTKNHRILSGHSLSQCVQLCNMFNVDTVGLNCVEPDSDSLDDVRFIATHTNSKVLFSPNIGQSDLDPRSLALYISQVSDYVDYIGTCCGSNPSYTEELRKIGFHRTHFCSHTQGGLVLEKLNTFSLKKVREYVDRESWSDLSSLVVNTSSDYLDICFDSFPNASDKIKSFIKSATSFGLFKDRIPVVDSTDYETLVSVVRDVSYPCIANSIKYSEKGMDFINQFSTLNSLGSVPVILCSLDGSVVDSIQSRMRVIDSIVNKLTVEYSYSFDDFIIDPVISAIGLKDNDHNALDFIVACRLAKQKYPRLNLIGGVSNLSSAFKGRPDLRRALEKVLLSELEGVLNFYISKDPVEVDDLLLERARSFIYCEADLDSFLSIEKRDLKSDSTQSHSVVDCLLYDLDFSKNGYVTSSQFIENEIAEAFQIIGDRFSAGEVVLPQLIRSSQTLKKLVSSLNLDVSPLNLGRVLLATVEGDVHDVGKNIVKIILECSGYEVIDLGVQVPSQIILENISNVKAVCLSGLITPSLGKMEQFVDLLRKSGSSLPVFLGGAVVRQEFAMKLCQKYKYVYHTKYASDLPREMGLWI